MITLEELLQQNRRIVFVGLGNVLKGDDGIGVYIGQNIQENVKVKKVIAEISPENHLGKINELKPSVIVFADAVDFNRKPGFSELLTVSGLQDQTCHTHNVSLERLKDFLTAPIYVLGIQPRNLGFGDPFSKEALVAADRILKKINFHSQDIQNPESLH